MRNYRRENKELLLGSYVKENDQITTKSISIVDFLSSSNEFKPLIKSLQHTRLINYLNFLKNITFIAPTEKAFLNKTELTAEILKYHILNGLFFKDKVNDGFVFRSRIYSYGEQEGPIGVKVKKIVNISTKEEIVNVGGVSIVRGDYITRNGIVQVTNEIMILPKDMYYIFSRSPDLSIFMGLLDYEIFKYKKITIFAPINEAFKIFNDVEYAYLLSKYGVSDLRMLVHNHLQINTVIYKSDVIDKFSSKSDANEILNFSKNQTGFYVNEHKITEYDIITKNGSIEGCMKIINFLGVIHKISSLLFPASLEFTPLKYLYGMDTKKFANEIFVTGLADLINNKTIEQAIFAPIDSSLYLNVNMENYQIIQEIKYHLIPCWLDINTLEDQMLLTTKMKGRLLGGKEQKIKISKKNGKIWLNDRSVILGNPFTIGKTQIYRIDSELIPPFSFPAAAAPMFHISTTMEYLYNTNIDIQLHNKESLTYLVPLNSAWENLGLVRDYLLLESSKDMLREVLLNIVLDGVVYSEEFLLNRTLFTLRGVPLTIQKKSTGFSIFSRNNSHTSQIERRDILLENGVAHTVSQVFIPPNLNIIPQHLFLAKNISLFPQSIEFTDFFYVLNPEEKFTILAPINSVWKLFNDTVRNHIALQEIIKLHLLPPLSSNSDFLKDAHPRQSLHKSGVKITALKIHGSLYYIFFHSSKNCYQRVNVLGEGKTTFRGQIIIIDQVLDPTCAISLSYIYILRISFLFIIIFITFYFFVKKILLKTSFGKFIASIASNYGFGFSNRYSNYRRVNTHQYSDERRPFYFRHLPDRSSSRPILHRMLTV
ncbi:hypothetical protein PORY_002677 [Pneumocystis oryctolagi]|uniref:Uncharacterized protein n=1 Tax=Pneumocystis oryctolagi TaxID=42067 RepID=A0ACB7CAI0_9ASCO|nr:hypothetical protein PORY_002677 [Pneumocystis oryctolagi]